MSPGINRHILNPQKSVNRWRLIVPNPTEKRYAMLSYAPSFPFLPLSSLIRAAPEPKREKQNKKSTSLGSVMGMSTSMIMSMCI